MKKLLLVEDDESLGATLQERLQKEGYAVEWARTLRDARTKASGDPFSLVKDAIPELLAGWSEAFALRQAKLLFQLGNAFAQVPVS